MRESKYCKWYCDEWLSRGRWSFISQCGERKEVSRHSDFYNRLYKNDDKTVCPKCGKIITVGELM